MCVCGNVFYIQVLFAQCPISVTPYMHCTHKQCPHALPWSLQDGYVKERTLDISRFLQALVVIGRLIFLYVTPLLITLLI